MQVSNRNLKLYLNIVNRTVSLNINDDSLFFKSNIDLSKNYKFLTLVNADCPSCISHLQKTEKFIMKHGINNCIVIEVGEPNSFFFNQVEKNDWSFTLYLDNKKNIIKNNPHLLKANNTYLLDTRNKIVLCGNPFENKFIEETYIKNIKRQ